jgi:hypothetical protein
VPAVETKAFVNIDDYLREYARLDALAVEQEKQFKATSAKRDVIEAQVIEKYAMEGVSSLKIEGLGSFPMTTMTRASIKADQSEAGIALMKKYYPDLVKETVNAQTLSGFVSNAIKNQQELPADLMEKLNVFKKQYISWRK